MGGSDSADGMFIFSLTGRRVHIDDQRFKAKLSQRHGRGNAYRAGSGNYYIIVQFYNSLFRTK
jgi:hypothetical protein